jgi:hypothetical protein
MQRRSFLALPVVAFAAACASVEGPRFASAERDTISNYYAGIRGRKPAAEAPPQSAKRGDTIDPGKRPKPLPDDLANQLPHLPEPYTRMSYGADVIVFNRNTQEIVDVIPQVAY